MQDRLLEILTYFGYSAARFADEIGVQRSGISHILSGRNNPSYDFILKIMKRFPEINLEWLVLGEGNMLKDEMRQKNVIQSDLFSSMKSQDSNQQKLDINNDRKKIVTDKIKKVTNVNSMDQIVIFYTDGTCRTYYPTSSE